MTYLDYCNYINITDVEQCAQHIAKTDQKLWVVFTAILIIFILMQVFITSIFTKKKSSGFWFGVVGLNIILLLIVALFILLLDKIIIALGIV